MSNKKPDSPPKSAKLAYVKIMKDKHKQEGLDGVPKKIKAKELTDHLESTWEDLSAEDQDQYEKIKIHK